MYNMLPSLGHAEAFSFPDYSHLTWKYKHDASGIQFSRNNVEIFLEAAEHIFDFLCSATGKAGNWKSLVKKISTCFLVPTDELKRKYAKYAENFSEIRFEYDEKEWRRLACQGGSHGFRDLIEEDYQNQTYNFIGDKKWFYFHEAAYHQRNYVLAQIKNDLL